MAFRFMILCAALAYANAGLLGAPIAAPALAYSSVAAPTLGSTFHGRLAAPAVSYAAPAVSYAAPALSYAAPAVAPAITSQHSNIIRSFGNLGQVSTYSKSIDTPFSSVRKADIRVSNPGFRTVAAPAIAYGAAPAISAYHGFAAPAVAAPAISTYHGFAAPAVAAPVLRTAVAAPAIAAHPAAIGVAYSAAPAVSHLTYASSYANYGW